MRASRERYPAHLILLSLLSLLSPPLSASYLSELEAEASALDRTPRRSQPSLPTGSVAEPGQKMPEGLSQDEFEKYLRDNHFGSHVFYDRLTDWNKKKVYETYQSTLDVEAVRNDIKAKTTK